MSDELPAFLAEEPYSTFQEEAAAYREALEKYKDLVGKGPTYVAGHREEIREQAGRVAETWELYDQVKEHVQRHVAHPPSLFEAAFILPDERNPATEPYSVIREILERVQRREEETMNVMGQCFQKLDRFDMDVKRTELTPHYIRAQFNKEFKNHFYDEKDGAWELFHEEQILPELDKQMDKAYQ